MQLIENNFIFHAHLHLWQQWLTVQFGFLSAYGLFDLYMHFPKGDENGHLKQIAWLISLFLHKQVGGRRHFGFL